MKSFNKLKTSVLFIAIIYAHFSYAQFGGLGKLKDATDKVKSAKSKVDNTMGSDNTSGGNSGNTASTSIKSALTASAELYFSSVDVNTKLTSFKEGDIVKAVIKTEKAIKNAMPFDGPNTNDVYQMVIYKDGAYLETFPLRFVNATEYKSQDPYADKTLDAKRIYFDEATRSNDKLVFTLMAPQNNTSSFESYMLTHFFYNHASSGKYKIQIQKDNYPEPIIVGVSEFDFESIVRHPKLRTMLQSYKNYITKSDFFVASYSGNSKQEIFKDGDEIKAVFKTEKTLGEIFPDRGTGDAPFTLSIWVDGKNASTWAIKYINSEEFAKKDPYALEGKVLYVSSKDKIPYQYAIDKKKELYYKDADKSSKQLVFDLITSKDHATTYGAPLLTRNLLQNLKTGTHKIEIQIVADRPNSFNEVCYYTEFDYDCSASTDKSYLIYEPYDKIFQKNITELVSKTTFPKAAMVDATIEKDFKTLFPSAMSGNVTLTKVSLTYAAWEIEKNKYSGLPLRRKMQACVGFKDKVNPSKCLYHYFWIVQEYEGGGKYGKSLIDNTYPGGDIVEYNCNNL